jgi:hypothetical protein
MGAFMRAIRLGVLTALLFALSTPARADIIDFGVNILSSGATTQVEDGFWGDNNGYRLANSCVLIVICTQNSYQFAINTSGLDGADVESAELSFDVNGQSLLEVFAVFALSGTYQFIGLLGSHPIDLNLASFGDEIENGALSIIVRTVTPWGESVRLDGANLRIESADPTESVNRVPEPGTLLLTGLGLAAAGILPRRRRLIA